MIESHVSRDFNRSAADDKKIEIHTEQLIPSRNGCPEMYILSKDNKLCYFIAKTHVKGATIGFRRLPYVIDALLVNKSDAVQFCKFPPCCQHNFYAVRHCFFTKMSIGLQGMGSQY